MTRLKSPIRTLTHHSNIYASPENGCSSRNVPSGAEPGEAAVFAGYAKEGQ